MPWVRIDENAIDHPKFLALSDGAWRLWCEGQAYCQKHLTDGRIGAAALRRFRYYSPARVRNLTAVHVLGKGPCWHQDADGNIEVHDYFDWNESRETVLAAREGARDRRRRSRVRHASGDAGQTANVPCGVECLETDLHRNEGGVGETREERAGAFCRWYEATHQRLFGVGYMGTQNDYQKALEMVDRFSDAEMQDAALVWFGQDDDFATRGTRTVPKFASRITGCLQTARARGIA